MSDRTQVTIAIPTFRRPDALSRLLRALATQHDPGLDWQVLVVVNDGSTPTIPSDLTDRVPVSVVAEHQPGAANARNRALGAAATELLAFIDDDVVPHPTWLRELVTPMLGSALGATCGRVQLDPAAPRPAWWCAAWMDSYLAAFDRGPAGRHLRPGEYGLTANLCVRTERLKGAGGFSSRLGPRDGRPTVNDDVQVSSDLLRAGESIAWVPSAIVVHEVPVGRLNRRWLARRMFWQGWSDVEWLAIRDRSPLPVAALSALSDLAAELVPLLRQTGWSRAGFSRLRWASFIVGGVLAHALTLRQSVEQGPFAQSA